MSIVQTSGDTVKFDRIAPGGFRILGALEYLADNYNYKMVITSACDSHAAPDPHFRGEAYDIAIVGFSPDTVADIVVRLANILGQKFTVLYEVPSQSLAVMDSNNLLQQYLYVNSNATGPHIHIQVRIGESYP